MIRASLSDGSEARLSFKVQKFDPPLVRKRKNRDEEVTISHRVTALLQPIASKEILHQAETDCSILDRFDKEEGRLGALGRLVAKLPRQDRGAILEAYYSRSRARSFPKVVRELAATVRAQHDDETVCTTAKIIRELLYMCGVEKRPAIKKERT